MKAAILTYTYDPQARSLSIYENGKPRGGFIGPAAERRFLQLMESGVEITITAMNTEANRKLKIKKLRAIWIAQGIDKYRDSILEQYGVTSTADLKDADLDDLIRKYSNENFPPANDAIRKLRSEVLNVVTKLGVYDGSDWQRVNAFFMNPRIAGKLLYQMNEEELKALRTKLWTILKKYAPPVSDAEIKRQQMMN